MKKLLAVIPVILIMASCALSPAKIQKEFKAQVVSEYNGIKIKADIESRNHTINIKIKSPENLDGYSYNYSSSKLTVKYNDLMLESDSDYLPENAFTNVFYYVLSTINKDEVTYSGENNGKAEYSGKCKAGGFIIHSDFNTGYISDLELKSTDFKAEFENK